MSKTTTNIKPSRLKRVFDKYRQNTMQYALVSLIFVSLMLLSSLLFGVLPRYFNFENSTLLSVLVTLGSLLLNGFLLMGFGRFFLKASRFEKPNVSELFSGGKQLAPFILLQLILGAGFIVICFFAYLVMAVDRHSAFWGLTGLLLTLPFLLFWLIKTMFAYLQVIESANPIGAIRASFSKTKNRFWKLLAYLVPTVLLNALGAMTLGMGLFFTLPFTTLLLCDLYDEAG